MPERWADLPFQEALDVLTVGKDIDVATLKAWAAQNSATLSTFTKGDILQGVLDYLTYSIQQGGTIGELIENIPALTESLGIRTENPWRVETIFRNAIQSAYGSGLWERRNEEGIAGWLYETVLDDRVRPSHAALHGKFFRGSSFASVFPPWDFNCRCGARWLTFNQAKGLRATGILPMIVQERLESTQFISPALQQVYNPDLGGMHVGLIAQINRELQGRK